MKKTLILFATMVMTLLLGWSTITILGADTIAVPTAVVTVKDFNFFATGNNPVGVTVDPRGDVKVGILGLPILVNPRPSTPIVTVTPGGETSDFATMPLAANIQPCRDARPGRDHFPDGSLQEPTPFMTGFAYHRSGDLYVGLPNCIPGAHGIYRVSSSGVPEPFAQMPLSQLPKGLSLTNGGFPLYATDLHDFTRSRADCKASLGTATACTLKIWRIDQSGNVTDWVKSTLFYGDPDSPLLHPHGVNGIVVDDAGQNVYVTVTDHGRIIRIPINRDGSAGTPQVIFEDKNFWGMDGITLGPDGNLYVVIVRTDQLVALRTDGSGFQVLLQGHPLDGPTQLAFGKGNDGPGSRDLPPLYITNGSGARVFFFNVAFILGNGNFLDGLNALVNFGIKTALEVANLQPTPSLVRVSLKKP